MYNFVYKDKINIYYIILSVLIFNSVILLSGFFGWPYQFCINSVSSLLVYSYIRYENLKFKIFYLIGPTIYITLILYAGNFHVLPIAIIPFVIFCLFELINPNKIKLRHIGFLIILFTYPSFILMSIWLSYYRNIDMTTYVGKKFPQLNVIDKNKIISDSLLFAKDQLIVIDCWSSNCGICFIKFPEFSKLQNFYINKKVKFYTLNLPLKKDSFEDITMLISHKYDRKNNLFATKLSAWSDLGVNGVPVYFILKNGKILFFGSIPIEAQFPLEDLQDKITHFIN